MAGQAAWSGAGVPPGARAAALTRRREHLGAAGQRGLRGGEVGTAGDDAARGVDGVEPPTVLDGAHGTVVARADPEIVAESAPCDPVTIGFDVFGHAAAVLE